MGDGDDFQPVFDRVWQIGNVLFIFLWNEHRCDPTAQGRQQLFFQSTDGKRVAAQGTSPVMAISLRTGMPVSTDTMDVTIARPALGPSLGVAPSGT